MTLTLGQHVYRLEEDERCYDWATDVPLCPACGSLLTAFCEEGERASVQSFWHDEQYVICDGCGWRSERLS